MAAQALGGVPVPIYRDSIEREMEYIVEHSEARFAIVEDQEQVDKLLGVRARCRHLQHVVYDDPRGMRGYREPGLSRLAELTERGKKFEVSHPAHFDAELARGAADDIAIICYTSGTTGAPKGAMLSHRNLIATARNAARFEGLREDEEVLSYLPMAWVGDHVFSYAQAIVTGFTINCPESAATVLADLKEIAPTYFFGPPRIWESILTSVMLRIEDAAAPKRALVHFSCWPRTSSAGARPPADCHLAAAALPQLGNLLLYGPLKDNSSLRTPKSPYGRQAIGPGDLPSSSVELGRRQTANAHSQGQRVRDDQRDGDVRLARGHRSRRRDRISDAGSALPGRVSSQI
jgi:long-chain acyl-CoA synthetase